MNAVDTSFSPRFQPRFTFCMYVYYPLSIVHFTEQLRFLHKFRFVELLCRGTILYLPFRGGVAEGDGGVVEYGLTPQSASLTAPLKGSY